jgi:hypothetical protein
MPGMYLDAMLDALWKNGENVNFKCKGLIPMWLN